MADIVTISKFLSLILRHNPGEIGLTLDSQGWALIDDLLEKANAHGKRISRQVLDRVVAENDKKRFAISDDGQRIRASQGHSLEINLALSPQEPPEFLFHGTASRFVDSILQTGLNAGNRQHVHLSLDQATAVKVGQRHGKPVVLTVRAGEMARSGFKFFLSDNGVWLTDSVPPAFISLPTS
jgi:putative RNA 2'-phosphotransferase